MSDPVVSTIEVRCAPAHAFEVFTRRVDLWWPVGHRKLEDASLEFECRTGGRFMERSPSGEVFELGTILDWDPPRRFRYSWVRGAISAPTEVEVVFEPHGKATRVIVTHAEANSGLGDAWPTRARGFKAAWSHVLPTFADFITNETDRGESS